MRILSISCLLWTILFTRQVKGGLPAMSQRRGHGELKCTRTNRQPDRMCEKRCSPLTGCGDPEKRCLCDGDCGYSCVRKDLSCGRPPRVSNAEPQYTSTNLSSIVTYVCNEGYTLSGAAKRTCRANGRWDGVGPNCLKMCTLPNIPFSTYIAKPENYNREYRTGERITLACKKGFTKKPGGNPVRICISGLWTRFPFHCEGNHACKRTIRAPRTKCTEECSPESGCGSDKKRCLCDGSCGFSCVEIGMSCGNPPSISNGNLVYNETSYNSTARYTCNEGYSLNTAPVKRCTAKKRWEGLTPRCLKDCTSPPIPKNANISNPRKKYHSGYKVTFKCNEGYNQEGMATQMCFLGSWTVLPFKCTEGGCGDPGTPENGRKLGVTYSVNSRVYFDCDLGYELEGSADRKCQLNGSWTGIQPVCKVVNCGFPPRPKNGTFIGNGTTFKSELEFKCDKGFELQGTVKRMCTSDKSWGGKEVTCTAVDCRSLDSPKNGSLIGKETSYPNHVEIKCDEGFTLLGPRRRTCQANGKWSGNKTECKAVDCGALSVLANGSSIGIKTTFPNKIRFSCDLGFDLVGSAVRMCMPNKTWSGVMTVCKAVDCGELPSLMNGSVIGEETTFLNEVEISCDKGFILRGSRRRKCEADRKWSGDTTICEAINCGKPKLPDHGSVSGVSTRYPHSITFTCDIGYEIQGSVVRKCQADGTWSGNKTTCKPIDCGPLRTPNNGSKADKKTTFLNTINFFCNEGFYIKGSSKRICQADGQWSGVKTSCEAVDCGSLTLPQNGSKFGQETTYPNFIKFSCDEGFFLSGSTLRSCLANGTWSGMQTLCKAKDCGPIQAPRNGSKVGSQTIYPNAILFTCDKGFNLIGSNERQCTSDGVWSGMETLCQAKDCGLISLPLNGSKHGSQTTYLSRVTVSCDNGFHLRGSAERECMSDGLWSGVEAYCEAKDCGSLEIPTNGSLVGLNVTTFPNSLTFVCDDGFILKGSRVRHCQANAMWSGNKTFCQAKDCGPIETPANGSLLGDSTTYPHEVLFSCDKGFLLRGSNLRRCTSERVWSGMPASCEAKNCGPLPVLLNGTAIGRNTVYPNEIAFHCNAGFNLVGSRIRRCQSTGIWSGNQTSCQALDCGHIKILQNGSTFGEKTTYPHSVRFSCDEGFTLLGSTVRHCLSNGIWSGQQALCQAKDCGPLALPLNGSSFGRDTTFPNVISFYCDIGFIMIGSQTRKCQANGKWSGNETTCRAVECGSLAMPLNGSTYGELTTYPNKVYFNCDEGFVLEGSSVRICMANGSWSGNETFCAAINCGELAVPENGTLQGSATTFPSRAEFSCYEGFVLEGSNFRWCQANGTWSGANTSCRAKDCGHLPFPMNGSVFGSQTTFPNKLEFSCDNGFDLIGSTVRRCKADGLWSGQQPTCQAVDCGPLPLLLNGTYLGNLSTYPNEALASCDEGFLLKGSAKRFCQANRTWSGIQTTCVAVNCGPLSVLANGSSYGSLTYFPNSIQFFCDSGFILRGSSERSCLSTGLWSGNRTTCEAIDCGGLSVPMNGSLKGTRTYFPNVLRFSCVDGFILGGSKERQCLANGSWSGDDTFCKAVDCGPLPVLRNGSSHGDMTVYPNSVWFSCDAGFFLRGPSRRTCQANGTWSGSLTQCNPVNCGLVAAPKNGSMRGNYTTFPNNLLFYCDDGFILNGSSTRRCTETGIWSGEQTVCIAKDCGFLKTPKNGSMIGTETTFPNAVAFSCDEGFLMQGPKKRKCQKDGTWSGNETICTAIDCGQLKVPTNGSLHGDRTVFPESQRFKCDIGFIMSGSPVRQCQSNGTWSGTETTCSAIDCGRLSVPLNGSVYGDQTTYPNILHFSCHEGFTQHGSTERRCQSNGTWSGRSAFCHANNCGPLAVPINGSSLGTETTFPNKVTFRCDEGFILVGSTIRQCQANASWSGVDTTCEAIDCGFLDAPTNGSSSGNLTVYPNTKYFTCDPGFLLGGSPERTCRANGTWSGTNTTCAAIDCGSPSTLMNGSVYGEQTIYPNALKFECDEGFTLLGSAVRKCQTNGTWSGVEPFCQANDCGNLSVPLNGSLFGNETTFPNVITFSCDEGFILKGSNARKCQANMTWTGEATYCDAVDCGPLDTPISGSLFGSLTVFPNSLRFACDPGFILSGSSVRTCQSNSIWSGSETTCSAIDCGPLSVPYNGSVLGKTTVYPSILQFTCDEGFTLHGSSHRRCQTNGTWSGNNSLCKANDCGPLSVPTNGTSFGNLTTFPNEISFTCDEGFILHGSALRNCQANKLWSGNETFCEAVDCGHLDAPKNGSLSGDLTMFPNSLKFQCDLGFILKGSNIRKCQANGTWSGLKTTCHAINCGQIQIPQNGSMIGKNTTYPNTLRFTCDVGFTLVGAPVRKCQANGTWSGTETLCQANDCGSLSVPWNGSLSGNLTTYPNKVSFSCDEGFILRGSAVRQCQPNKLWSGNDSFCEAKDCGILTIPMNGSLEGSQTTFPNKAIFGCDDGFILRGSSVRRCLSSGKWSGNKTFCEAKDCGELVTPTNGSSFGNLTTYPHEITFSCDKGFILRGSWTRQCLSSGNWSGNTTICFAIDCGELMTPQNGTIFGEVTTYPNILRFNCDEGFILTGSSVRKCGTNGTWSGNETKCQAKDCGSLAVPVNGSSIGDLTVFPHKVVFNCDEGFLLSGSHIRHCQANGTWSGNQTFCQAVDCGALSVPTNGSSLGAATVYPNSQRFICDPGFILNGSSVRTCQSNGIWNGFPTTCSAVDCGRPQPLRNGSVIGENTVYPNLVIHDCDEGFILRGSAKLKCQTNGTWSRTDSFCEAKDCGDLSKPLNGSMTGRVTTFPNKVTFDCDEGFILNGSSVRHCQSNGSWSGKETSCSAVDCGSLSPPMNGSSHGVSTVFPNSIQFSCEPGFILSGSSQRSCQPNGTWSGFTTVCTAKDCGPLGVPANGSRIGSLTTFPNKIDFSCDKGFLLRGSQTRHCEKNGTWSGNQTICQAVDCGSLSVPVNGSSSGGSTVYPNNLLFHCDTGFILSGSTVRTCQPNATWSGSPTACSAVDCGSLSFPMNGSSFGNSTVFPNSIHFQCDPGFLLNGSVTRTCQANGTWSGFEGLCSAVDCGDPQPLQNGSIVGKKTVYPNYVTHRCDEGFILRGSSRITCQANGTWSKTSSYCEAKNCGALDILTNGSMTGGKTTYPNKVHFSCDDGFIIKGSTARQCRADGTWSGNDTSCEAVDCGPLLVPVNGSSSGNSTNFPNDIIFKCDHGFNLYGSPVRMCQANGTWSGKAVSCAAKDCGLLAVPTNGSSTGELTFFPNEITFNCDKGFILKGSPIRQCQANGNWSGNQTFCEAVDCGPLSNPMNGSSSGDSTVFPNSVLFDCDLGFVLSGSHERKCLANGSWSGLPTVCCAVNCGPISVPMNGSSSGNFTVFPNAIVFSCDPGFVLNGSTTRKCRANGTWSGLQAVCNAIDCGIPKPLQNGTVIGEKTVYPNFVTHICDEGFILRGPARIKCQTNGTWSKTSSFCEVKDCGALPIPLNGSVTGPKTTFPNIVTFSCDEGFILNGSTVRQCEANGSWGGIQTSCQAVDCGLLSVPKNGSSFGDSTVFSNSLQFACDPGFILDGSHKRTCQANGTWDGLETVCIAKDCGALEIPSNGSLHGDLTIFPNKIDFSCDKGFLLRGSQTRQCQSNGTWSGVQTYCEAVDCGPLSVPMNGSVFGNSTVFPNNMQFSCDPGFILNGSAVRTCQPNGIWNGIETTCMAVNCGHLPVLVNGSSSGDSTVFPNSIKFSCDPGFILSGSASRMCQTNGTWGGTSTVCSAVDCGPLRPLQNGSYKGKSTVFPNVVNAVCEVGFILRGASRLKCQANGRWSSTDTFCDAKDCGNVPRPLNGSVIGDKTTYPSEVEFKCDAGFNLQGSATRRCEASGQWSGVGVTCQAVDCGPLATPEHGVAHGNSTTYPNTINFSCNTGFFLQGESSRTCQADGTWTSGEMHCQGKDCGKLSPPENGWMFGSDTSHPSVMVFSCAFGYSPVGSFERTCLKNGSWSGQQPKCLPRWCNQAPDIPAFAYQTWTAKKNRHEEGERIYYSCKAGLMMVGIPVRKCVKGRWTKANFNCSAPNCDAPPVPEFAYLTWARGVRSKYLNGDTVYYSCQVGYELLGTPYIECKDNSWTQIDFTCKAVDCGLLDSPLNGGIIEKTGNTFGATYVFKCDKDKGYLMEGSKERRCLANATWSGVQPVCQLQSCDAPRQPLHGKFKPESRSKYSFENVVGYQCNSGYSLRGHERTKCLIHGNWSHAAPTCTRCSKPLGLKNRMIFSRQLSASSERDSRHTARHGRLDGNSAWCSARSSFTKYFQIDFGRTVEVTSVATQGHPREDKWIQRYILRYSLGKNWFTYQESRRDKIFNGNKDGSSIVRHYLKERLVAKKLRIIRYENSRDFMGSTVCLRAEVYGCAFETECLTVGSEVFVHWNSVKKHSRFIHGYVTRVRQTSVNISPSGKHGGNTDSIFELPRKKEFYVIKDEKSSPQEIRIGSKVIVASSDKVGFSQGTVTQKYFTWYGVQLGNGETVWGTVDNIRLLKRPIYCENEHFTA